MIDINCTPTTTVLLVMVLVLNKDFHVIQLDMQLTQGVIKMSYFTLVLHVDLR
jgi:hypothetical protein